MDDTVTVEIDLARAQRFFGGLRRQFVAECRPSRAMRADLVETILRVRARHGEVVWANMEEVAVA
jgi:hypothetical protein